MGADNVVWTTAYPLLPRAQGVAVYRHHSGAWTMIGNDGTVTVGHPAGALISMGPGGAKPPNPVGADADGLWQHAGPNAAAPVALRLTMPAGAIIAIDTAGKVSITAPAEVAFTVPKITTTGDIEAAGDVKAGTVSLKNHTHGGVDPGGSNTAAPNA